MKKFFSDNDSNTVLEAQYEAHKIAFAPVIFQVAKSMRDLGILELLYNNNKSGLSIKEISKKLKLSNYGVQTLLETSLSADIVKTKENKYFITKTGYFLFKDETIKINMNFIHYVNYKGLYYLEDSIKEQKAIGLKVFGNWKTIYPAVSSLPKKAKNSWFDFDHHYSDSAFSYAIDLLVSKNPKTVLDIGGNTGKFSIGLAKKSKDINITLVDLQEQVTLAKENIKKESLENRISFIGQNVLDENLDFPKGYDIIWMSQFLDCFNEDDIIKLLKKAKKSMSANSYLYIMEPLWDKQRFEASAYCIINTSPYFTALANGCSKMFNSSDLLSYIEKAGLNLVEQINHIGICQTIIICK